MMALNAIVVSRVARTEPSIVTPFSVNRGPHMTYRTVYDWYRRDGRHTPTVVLTSDMSACSIDLPCRSIVEGGRVDLSARVSGSIPCRVEVDLVACDARTRRRASGCLGTSAPHFVQRRGCYAPVRRGRSILL